MEYELDRIDKQIIRVLSDDFPVVSQPYRELAAKIGLTETELIARVNAMRQRRQIRKVGAVLRHPKVGFTANVLCAWEVPPEKLADTVRSMCAHPAISHCYERKTLPDWPYNVYTMIHGENHDGCEAIIDKIAAANGLTNKQLLYTVREWKKESMKYFVEATN